MVGAPREATSPTARVYAWHRWMSTGLQWASTRNAMSTMMPDLTYTRDVAEVAPFLEMTFSERCEGKDEQTALSAEMLSAAGFRPATLARAALVTTQGGRTVPKVLAPWGEQPTRSMSKYLSKAAAKRVPLNTKHARKGFYKGKGGRTEGRLTKNGNFIVDPAKRLELVVPDLTEFKVRASRLGDAHCASHWTGSDGPSDPRLFFSVRRCMTSALCLSGATLLLVLMCDNDPRSAQALRERHDTEREVPPREGHGQISDGGR